MANEFQNGGILKQEGRSITLAENDGRRKTYEITQGKQALRIEYDRLKALIQDSWILEEGEENG